MANTLPSPNMNLPIPTVSVDAGPDYATNINSSLTILDQHNHTAGQGLQVPSAGLNINTDLTFQDQNATQLRSTRYQVQGSLLALASDVGCLYVSGVDLYFNDVSGNQVRVTQSGGIAGSPGSIANLTAPASASYVSGSSTFVWQSAANTPANMDNASVILRNLSASSKGLTLSPPAAMGADYTLTLPSLPVTPTILTVDAAGTISASVPNNYNFPGKQVKEAGLNLVVSNTNTTNSLAIVRGSVVGSSGAIAGGEGFGCSRASAGVYNITWSSAFLDLPAVTVSSNQNALLAYVLITGTTLAQVNIVSASTGNPFDSNFSIIAIGQRA